MFFFYYFICTQMFGIRRSTDTSTHLLIMRMNVCREQPLVEKNEQECQFSDASTRWFVSECIDRSSSNITINILFLLFFFLFEFTETQEQSHWKKPKCCWIEIETVPKEMVITWNWVYNWWYLISLLASPLRCFVKSNNLLGSWKTISLTKVQQFFFSPAFLSFVTMSALLLNSKSTLSRPLARKYWQYFGKWVFYSFN